MKSSSRTLKFGHGDENIVKLVEGGKEPPLILLHNGGGGVRAFFHFKKVFKTGLWAIQVTPDTPLDSLPTHARYYVQKIKAQQPRGPYRLGSLSATSILLVEMARILEANGDTVGQLAFIDHCPSLLLCPEIGIQGDFEYPLDDPRARRVFITNSFHSAATFLRTDGYGTSQQRRKQTQTMLAAYYGGEPTNEFARINAHIMERYLGAVFDFLVGLTPERKPERIMSALGTWMKSVKAVSRVQIYLASTGVVLEAPPQCREEWLDLGARMCIGNPDVIYLEGGHFQILSDPRLIEGLQAGFGGGEAKL
ncbi:Alpha/Beta hydrolase protein [Favolaschia claudopus]|uniref:Alpha/Beta hydrolase protein n=1 Tax=Favolaschia claudopus TaxID=2862362 RepID=A0AAW0ANJ4_9AGAR